MTRFAGKTVLVTGGASGIGLAAAERFGSEGARVIIADRELARANEAVAKVRQAGAPDAWAYECDVSSESEVDSCVANALARAGSLDVLVNNAGMMTFKPILDLTTEDWLRVLSVDLLGAFHFIKHALAQMTQGGAIVNVSSIQAIETEPSVAPYAAAKAALVSLTRSAAIEGRDRAIRVNAVLPGAIDTPMLWTNPNVKAGIEKIDRRDVGTAADVAAAIAFLSADEARFVNGTMLIVDGGRLDRL